MPNEGQIELSKYRLEKAAEMIEEAEVLFQSGHTKAATIALTMRYFML